MNSTITMMSLKCDWKQQFLYFFNFSLPNIFFANKISALACSAFVLGLQITRDYLIFARLSSISLHLISPNWQLQCCVSVMQPALFGSPLLSAVNCEDDREILVGMFCCKQSMYRPFAAFLKDGCQPCLRSRCEPCLLEGGVRNTESCPSNSHLGKTSRVIRQKTLHARYSSVARGNAAVIDHHTLLPVVVHDCQAAKWSLTSQ